MSAVQELIDSYAAGPKTLRDSVSGLTREQLVARPIAGKWSTLEVVCHIADFEPVFSHRMKRIIAEEKPTLMVADENRFVTALHYHERDVEEELNLIAVIRSQCARILRKLPETAFARIGVHSERGPRTLEQILMSAVNHIPNHVKFVREKRAALGV